MSGILSGSDTRRINLSEFPTKLELGCGEKRNPECIGLDMVDFGQEIVWNIDNGIPLPDNSISYVYSSHFVEHLDERQIENLFLELVRVCQNGAIFESRCPSDRTILRYYTNHFSQWNEDRVKGICQGWNYGNGRLEVLEMHEDSVELFFKIRILK